MQILKFGKSLVNIHFKNKNVIKKLFCKNLQKKRYIKKYLIKSTASINKYFENKMNLNSINFKNGTFMIYFCIFYSWGILYKK